MKKSIYLLMVFAIISLNSYAQEDISPDSAWHISGTHNLLFNQASFNHWSAGGQNSLAANLLIDYNFNYAKNKWSWDTKLHTGYGLSKLDNVGWRKSEDIFNVNSIVGYKAAEYWRYTFFLDVLTQFTKGYNYSSDGSREYISNMFAPAYIQFGPGIGYKKSDNFYFNFSPLASKIIVVADDILSNQGAFGVDSGSTADYQFGANALLYVKYPVIKNVTIENKLQLFTNYLSNPQNIDINNQLNMNMKINDYMSAYFGLQLIYDDDILLPMKNDAGDEYFAPHLQLKQLLGVGFTYKFAK